MESLRQKEEKTKVLIIGAGRTGMLAARHISTVPNCEVTVVEAKSEIGGLWSYDELNEFHPKAQEAKRSDNYYRLYNCFQGAIYPHLITNLPSTFMSYKDFTISDFLSKPPEFLSQKEYCSYLNAYWDYFDLKKFVSFNTLVKSVRLYENLSEDERSQIKDLPPRTFVVTTVDSKGESISQNPKISTYDYVIVGSGMHVKPYRPTLNDISKFKGFVMHSKDFREPDDPIYKDKTILMLGGSYSSFDLMMHLLCHPQKGRQPVNKVIVCASETFILDVSEDFKYLKDEGSLILKRGWVKNFTEDSVVFTDGTSEKIDVVVYCTGYAATYPFLDPADKILEYGGEETRDRFFGPLYKRLVSIRQPKMFFPGLIDFTAFLNEITEVQIMLLKHVIHGTLKLPSVEEMTKDYEQDIAREKAASRDGTLTSFFKIPPLTTDLGYLESLRKEFQHLYPGTEEKMKKNFERKVAILSKCVEFMIKGNLLQYKSFNYSEKYPEEVKSSTEFP